MVHLFRGRPRFPPTLPDKTLSRLLVAGGRVTEGQQIAAAARAASAHIPLAVALAELNLLGIAEATRLCVGHRLEHFLVVFARGDWMSSPDPSKPPGADWVEIPPERVVVEGLRRHHDEERLRSLADPERVVRPTLGLAAGIDAMRLTRRERAVLSFLDGSTSVEMACRAAACTPSDPRLVDSLRTIYACCCFGLLV